MIGGALLASPLMLFSFLLVLFFIQFNKGYLVACCSRCDFGDTGMAAFNVVLKTLFVCKTDQKNKYREVGSNNANIKFAFFLCY